MTRKKPAAPRKRTAFVPRLVLGISAIAVVPACVAGCGSRMVGVADVGFGVADTSFRRDVSVADTAFRYETSVADTAFGVADTAFGVADVSFGVADTGFGVADAGFSVADAAFDGPTGADSSFRPDATGVADVGFGPDGRG